MNGVHFQQLAAKPLIQTIEAPLHLSYQPQSLRFAIEVFPPLIALGHEMINGFSTRNMQFHGHGIKRGRIELFPEFPRPLFRNEIAVMVSDFVPDDLGDLSPASLDGGGCPLVQVVRMIPISVVFFDSLVDEVVVVGPALVAAYVFVV